MSQDKAAVSAEARANLASLDDSPRAFVRNPVMLEFLGLPDTGRLLEATLETALMDKLQQFLMELGKGFAFVARQQRISTETQDFYIDLVFFQLPAQVLCADRPETRAIDASRRGADGHVCAHVR